MACVCACMCVCVFAGVYVLLLSCEAIGVYKRLAGPFLPPRVLPDYLDF